MKWIFLIMAWSFAVGNGDVGVAFLIVMAGIAIYWEKAI